MAAVVTVEKNRANCAAYRAAHREQYNAYQRNYRRQRAARRAYEKRCEEIRARLSTGASAEARA